jgi:hypothetical protein
MAKTYVSIRDRVSTLVDRVNDITNLIGDPQRLDSAGYGTYAPFDSAGLLGDSDLVTALWEIKHKFDSADALIDQAVLTSSTPNFDEVYLSVWNNGVPGTNQLKIDSDGIVRAGGNLTLDASGGTLDIKKSGTSYASFIESSGEVSIYSGGTKVISTHDSLGTRFLTTNTGILDRRLETTNKVVHLAMNELKLIIDELDSDANADFSSILGPGLASLVTTDKSSLTAAVNETYNRIPDIYDSDGTLLN